MIILTPFYVSWIKDNVCVVGGKHWKTTKNKKSKQVRIKNGSGSSLQIILAT